MLISGFLQGELTTDNHFSLPIKLKRKSPNEIASKKSAEYRRRYAVLAELEKQISAHLNDKTGS